MENKIVPLMTSSEPYQKFAVEEALKGAGIPYEVKETGVPSAIYGGVGMVGLHEFHVPAERLQEAKDVLCSAGIVCEVSRRLFARALEEIVKPLLGQRGADLSRLARFIQVNNKETVKAILEAASREEGGLDLLADVFFQLLREKEIPALHAVSRVLGRTAGEDFAGRIEKAMSSGGAEERMAILEVIPDLPVRGDLAEALARGLMDPNDEVREAAGEALFTLTKGTIEFEADAPEEEREKVVEEFLLRYR